MQVIPINVALLSLIKYLNSPRAILAHNMCLYTHAIKNHSEINPSLKQSHNLQNDLQGRFANSGCTNTLYLVYEHSTDINVGAIKICSCRRFLDSAICQKYFDILSEQTRIV
ncbi:Hypothetical_protein [Hexamita inflata]|uniref:Hypothetical_protein n=1 Tax=Hexamita inflata TaxID=28002 RepID=A0AA86R0P8_9EUKA|nr:Hypothetical protein HINF_LOCUS51233 [Hexamita inflata]